MFAERELRGEVQSFIIFAVSRLVFLRRVILAFFLLIGLSIFFVDDSQLFGVFDLVFQFIVAGGDVFGQFLRLAGLFGFFGGLGQLQLRALQ